MPYEQNHCDLHVLPLKTLASGGQEEQKSKCNITHKAYLTSAIKDVHMVLRGDHQNLGRLFS